MGDSIKLPEHPFIDPDNVESTVLNIDGVLCLLQQYSIGVADVRLNGPHGHGLFYVLEGIRSAVKYLSHMESLINAVRSR